MPKVAMVELPFIFKETDTMLTMVSIAHNIARDMLDTTSDIVRNELPVSKIWGELFDSMKIHPIVDVSFPDVLNSIEHESANFGAVIKLELVFDEPHEPTEHIAQQVFIDEITKLAHNYNKSR